MCQYAARQDGGMARCAAMNWSRSRMTISSDKATDRAWPTFTGIHIHTSRYPTNAKWGSFPYIERHEQVQTKQQLSSMHATAGFQIASWHWFSCMFNEPQLNCFPHATNRVNAMEIASRAASRAAGTASNTARAASTSVPSEGRRERTMATCQQ